MHKWCVNGPVQGTMYIREYGGDILHPDRNRENFRCRKMKKERDLRNVVDVVVDVFQMSALPLCTVLCVIRNRKKFRKFQSGLSRTAVIP